MKRSRQRAAWVGVDDAGTIYLGSVRGRKKSVSVYGWQNSKEPGYGRSVPLTPTRCTIVLAAPRPKKRKVIAATEEQGRSIRRANHNRPAERRT